MFVSFPLLALGLKVWNDCHALGVVLGHDRNSSSWGIIEKSCPMAMK